MKIELIPYNNPLKSKAFNLCKKIKNEKRTLLSIHELYVLYQALMSSSVTKGDIAEVGVYKGGSAKLLCSLKENRRIYIFDTFEGLPTVSYKDDKYHKQGMYKSDMDSIKLYLSNFDNVLITKGEFPKTAKLINNRKFSFVHLDIDLFEGTLAALNYFWVRMSKGGVICIHDYPALSGINKAVNCFCKQKGIPVIEVPPTQAIIIKI